MLTFSDSLKKYTDKNYDDDIKNLFLDQSGNMKFNRLFHVLDPIDPTQLEESDNILDIIISRIFTEFKKFWQGGQKSKVNVELKNEMLRLFQKCYKHIITIKSKSSPKCDDISFEDSLEELARLGDSSNLKNDLNLLITTFFEIKFNEYDKYMLVIQIDDTDLNVKKAYEIVEDIRKYLMIPNVIILMATKIEQLTLAVEQQYRIDFKTLIDNNRISQYELQQMASKYIDKLIPDGRKIYLPVINALDPSEKVKILYYDKHSQNSDSIIDYKNCESIQDQIFRYIYIKTGLVFVKPDTGIHCFIPETMRELVNLLAILSKMDDISDIREMDKLAESSNNLVEIYNSERIKIDIKTRKSNINIFKDYFLNTWIRNNIDDAYINYLFTLAETPNDFKHKRIITDMFDVIENFEVYSLKKSSKEFTAGRLEFLKNIYDKKKNYDKEDLLQYSIGNVIEVLEEVEDTFQNQSIVLFIFAIKMIYTITLNEVFFLSVIDKVYQEPFKEFIGTDIFSKKVYIDYISPFNVEIDKYYAKPSDIGNSIENISQFVFKGYKDSDFDYLAFKEKKSLNHSRFSLLLFRISIPLLRYIYLSSEFRINEEDKEDKENIEDNLDNLIFLFLNMEVIASLQKFLIKYKKIRGESNNFERLKLFYENVERFIFATRRNVENLAKYNPKFMPFGYIPLFRATNYNQVMAITKDINKNKESLEHLFSFAPKENVDKTNRIIASLKMIRTRFTKDEKVNSAVYRITSFIKKSGELDKKIISYENTSLSHIKEMANDFDANTLLNDGINSQIKDSIIIEMDRFIDSIIRLDGEE